MRRTSFKKQFKRHLRWHPTLWKTERKSQNRVYAMTQVSAGVNIRSHLVDGKGSNWLILRENGVLSLAE